MSSVLDFVNTLLPRQEKHQILESIQNVQSEMNSITIPQYERAMTLVNFAAYKSDMFKDYNAAMKNALGDKAKGNVVTETLKALKNHNDNLTKLADIIQRENGDNITVESITYRKANILQLVAGIAGFVRYATRMIGFLWMCETGDVEARSLLQVKQPEFIWLRHNRSQFFATLEVGLEKPEKLAKTINALPDMVVSAQTDDTVEATMGKQNAIIKGFTVTYSPMLHIRRFIERLREAELERLEAERVWLDNCYNRAKDAQNGQRNPAVEKRIQVYADQLASTDRKIERLSVKPE